jgi:pimeloyl-ACP methyl ester carboxylesterase
MHDRNIWSAERRKTMRCAGHTGFGHYHERYVRCADGKWRIKHDEGAGSGCTPQSVPKISVPTRYAHFPAETRPTPRLGAEQIFTNIVRWTEMPSGRHFTASEQPQAFVEELRAFARMFR